MNRFFTLIKGIIGILLILAVGFGVFYWETIGRETLTYTDVIVLNQEVKKNVIITEDLLGFIKIPTETVIENAVTDPEMILGKEVKQYIPRGTQLSPQYFGESELVLKEDEMIFKIPVDWIKSFPNTIRRGDRVLIYGLQQIEEITQSSFTTENALEDFYEKKEQIQTSDPFCELIVAYVKDSANREVIDATTDRQDATANVSGIEVIITQEKLTLLKNRIAEGYFLLITYR